MISFECGHCGNGIKLPDGAAGKKGKCNKCGEMITVPRPEVAAGIGYSIADSERDEGLPEPPRPPKKKAKAVEPEEVDGPSLWDRANSHKLGLPAVSGIVLASIALGYFVGREHLKSQIAAAFVKAGDGMVNALSGNDAPDPAAGTIEKGRGATAAAEPKTPPAVPVVPMGEAFVNDAMELELVGVRVEKPEYKLGLGDGKTYRSDEECLLCTFRIKNKAERREMRYYDNRFASTFRMRDDVDNSVQGVVNDDLVGALRSGEKIAPEAEVTHIQLFVLPLPKTQHLDLGIDLKAFGAQGEITFRINAADIKGFPPAGKP